MNWYPWLTQLWAAPAAIGFAMLFNSHPSSLWKVAILAILGHLIRDLCVYMNSDLVMGTLIAAYTIGLFAKIWSKRLRQATPVLAISAAIPMVPGVPMFNTIRSLLSVAREPSNDVAMAFLIDAGANATRAILILFALALGISAPWLLKPAKK
ncbi:threonine/serine exporter family protein [Microvirga sp. W0021]|uniref:Threonine/serine exporter family protein n=1 Tax=Hohaiivirga grylli TaxID=3133970 RepID=A0ABV0BL29_9HYPH